MNPMYFTGAKEGSGNPMNFTNADLGNGNPMNLLGNKNEPKFTSPRKMMNRFLVHVEGHEQNQYIECKEIRIDEKDNTAIYADHVRIEFKNKVKEIITL